MLFVLIGVHFVLLRVFGTLWFKKISVKIQPPSLYEHEVSQSKIQYVTYILQAFPDTEIIPCVWHQGLDTCFKTSWVCSPKCGGGNKFTTANESEFFPT